VNRDVKVARKFTVERRPVGPLVRLGGKCDLDQMLERHPNAGAPVDGQWAGPRAWRRRAALRLPVVLVSSDQMAPGGPKRRGIVQMANDRGRSVEQPSRADVGLPSAGPSPLT